MLVKADLVSSTFNHTGAWMSFFTSNARYPVFVRIQWWWREQVRENVTQGKWESDALVIMRSPGKVPPASLASRRRVGVLPYVLSLVRRSSCRKEANAAAARLSSSCTVGKCIGFMSWLWSSKRERCPPKVVWSSLRCFGFDVVSRYTQSRFETCRLPGVRC